MTPKCDLVLENEQAQCKKAHKKDLYQSTWREFGSWLVSETWHDIFNKPCRPTQYDKFMHKPSNAIKLFLPLRRSKKHKSDKQWVTNQIKRWISKRLSIPEMLN